MDKRLRVDPKGSSKLDRTMAPMGVTGNDDPTRMIRLLQGAKGSKVGPESVQGVQGVPTTHYRFSVPPASYLEVMGSSTVATLLKQPVGMDLWVGSHNLPVKVASVVTVGGTTVKVQAVYSKWGKKVDVSAPPASQVTDKSPF